MPAILKNKLIWLVSIGSIMGVVSMHLFSVSQHKNEKRDPASIQAKFDKLPGYSKSLSKHLSVVTVSLQAPSEISEDSQDQTTELNASIILNQGPSQDLNVEWELPYDVIAVSGEKKIKLVNAIPGKVYQVSLVVKGFNKIEKKVIIVSANIDRDGIKLGSSSLISSRPEDSMEFIAPAMAEAASEIDTAPRTGHVIK